MAAKPPEPPVPSGADATGEPPWLYAERAHEVAQQSEPPRNGLRSVPDDGQPATKPMRALSSNSYFSLLWTLKSETLRERVIGNLKIELNELGQRVELGRQPLRDVGLSRIRADIEEKFAADKKGIKGRKYSKADVRDAVNQIADENRYHPVREYLTGLKWDGKKRLELVAEQLLDIKDPLPIVKTMLRKWFVAAVKRPMEPGCVSKSMLILKGRQDAAKSTWFKVLASPAWFNDNGIDIHSKEAHVILSSVWIQEWAELRELQGRTAEAAKSFISSTVGKSLPKFSNYMEEFPRCSIIVGTTNEARFLDDPTGNVRYWPVHVGPEIKLELTAAWRDQLWAEAMEIWREHETYDSWLTPEESVALKGLQQDFEHIDQWFEPIANFVSDRDKVATAEIFDSALKIEVAKRTRGDQLRVANVMRALGFFETRLSSLDLSGQRRRPHGWERSTSEMDPHGSPSGSPSGSP